MGDFLGARSPCRTYQNLYQFAFCPMQILVSTSIGYQEGVDLEGPSTLPLTLVCWAIQPVFIRSSIETR